MQMQIKKVIVTTLKRNDFNREEKLQRVSRELRSLLSWHDA